MSDYASNLELFKKALIEATNEEAQLILDNYPEDIVFSAHHEKMMKKIMNTSRKPNLLVHNRVLNKKRIIALLIAAIILLFGGLTVYAKRDAIFSFVEQVYDKFTSVIFQKDTTTETSIPETIDKVCVPTYIPEGYELQEYVSELSLARVKWQNSDEEVILYEQRPLDVSIFIYDNEQGSFEIIDVGEIHVYFVRYDTQNEFLWHDEKYTYTLQCSSKVTFEDVKKIILSLP